MTETAAIILAAGQGKRLKSALSKILHPLAGQPVVDYSVELARSLNVSKIVAVIPPGDGPIAAHLKAHHPDVAIAVQDPPLGTGHAVNSAKALFKGFKGDVLILSGDVPLLRRESLLAFYKSHRRKKATLSLMSCEIDIPFGYGRILRQADGGFSEIREERDASLEERAIHEVNAGIYWIHSTELFAGLSKLAPTNAQGEYYLTDLPTVFKKAGHGVSTWLLEDEEEMHGINTRFQLAEAHAILYRRTAIAAMENGVTILNPATVSIDPSVKLSKDVTLEAGVHLRGKTKVGEGTRIGVGSVIRDSKIGREVEILPYSVISESVIADESHIGPFAHLRPGSQLKRGAKVGNFVETKKSTLGEGAKANHLSYIGDTVVGKKANIGAGTITCNYDGTKKSKTVIGEGAFIGSNSSLIAPVEIGKAAVVGAGSAVSKDVPVGALCVERSDQRIVPNWAKRRRERG